ncbi:MAG: PAS domain-containing protein [Rhodospirillaceae bacterium]|nr:PAS domain-containing protein [Rhodospirillaceae bacterium]MBT7452096.1 PAS domain-containing protein [Rhodospirillaceae bacterium]
MAETSPVVALEYPIRADELLSALGAATFVVDNAFRLRYTNGAAEQLFQASSVSLLGQDLAEFLPADGPVQALIEQVFRDQAPVSEYGVSLDTPKTGTRVMAVHAAPLVERTDAVVVSLQEQTRALKIGQQLESRHSVRSVTAMAALLAHEVKNPLSGIRGAAQLLEQNAVGDDIPLTQLIRDEADRIVALVDRMEVFSDDRPLEREGVNIHSVLEHVRRIAENGFGKRIRFIEKYDPSLPPVHGNRDQLIQVLLNLVKNAAEALQGSEGEIILSTAYQPGVRLKIPGQAGRLQLPLVVSVSDNGSGIAEDLKPHLFDPFVTTKLHGNGLGLALVAKIVSDHGGVIEFDSASSGTTFKIMLPILTDDTVSHG